VALSIDFRDPMICPHLERQRTFARRNFRRPFMTDGVEKGLEGRREP
jgi:hypothetical protein